MSDQPTEAGRVTRLVVIVVVAVLALSVIAFVVAANVPSNVPEELDGAGADPDSPAPSPAVTGGSTGPVTDCPDGVVVSSAVQLHDALADAAPGDVIALAPGRYVGQFVAAVSGTADALITLCGTSESVLDGGDPEDGYVFHLDGVSYWHLLGFTVTNGQKGVMADGTVGSVIEGLTVFHIGDEAVHLRRTSTDNRVIGNTIFETGLRKPKFGEGVYIGTAESNWCDISGCEPDRSDRNLVEANTISGTTAEAIDIKEGTRDGIVRGNTFDGSAIVEADSWVDVKGNDWLIEGNSGQNSPGDGFQTHEVVDGWGTGNVFRGNSAEVNGPGFGYSLTPPRANSVACDNTASAAGEGLSNVPCSG
ncbi:MAG: right-handed parallel beta-helix repeat-containing protein [Pseudolysinimonas sp.]